MARRFLNGVDSTSIVVNQPVATSGSPYALQINGASHTTLTAGTEAPDVDLNLARTVEFNTGALATQRAVVIRAPTYAAVADSVITTAATVAIAGAPTAGANVTITNPYSFWVQAGRTVIGGTCSVNSTTLRTNAVLDVAGRIRSNDFVLGTDPDLSLLPVSGGQSVLACWHALQLVGNKQSTVEYTPANKGNNNDASVIIPNQQAGSVGLIIYGQTAQTSNLFEVRRVADTSGLTVINANGWIGIGQSTPTANLTITQAAATTGSPTALLVTGAAHTALTAGTEAFDVRFNLGRTVQWATGAKATQRAFLVDFPTYSAVGGSVITTAATLAISGAPAAGTNVTITNPYALWIQGGRTRLDGILDASNGVTVANGLTATSGGLRTSDYLYFGSTWVSLHATSSLFSVSVANSVGTLISLFDTQVGFTGTVPGLIKFYTATSATGIAGAANSYSGNKTLTIHDHHCLFTGTGGGSNTWTLPSASAYGAGRGQVFFIKNVGTNTLILNCASGDKFNEASATSWYVYSGENVVLISDGITGWTIAAKREGVDRYVNVVEDFCGGSIPGYMTTSVSGTGATVGVGTTAESGHPGYIRLNTGTNAKGRSGAFFASPNAILAGGGYMRLETTARISALSTTTYTYTFRFGFLDNITNIEPTDGIYFRYTHTVNGGNWVGVARSNNAESTINGTTGPVANAWVKLRIEVASDGSFVMFYADDVLVGTLTTNIPTGAGRDVGVGTSIAKSTGNGLAFKVDHDYFSFRQILTNRR